MNMVSMCSRMLLEILTNRTHLLVLRFSWQRSTVVMLLLHSLLAAQDRPRFEHISVQHGLSNSAIYCILQDRFGFLWIGTRDGLNKYDGYSFTVFKHDPLDTTSLGSSLVLSILEDHQGTLWIGSDGGGLQKYNREKNNFTSFMDDPNKPNNLAGSSVTALGEDKSGDLWIGAEGLYRFDRKTETLVRYLHDSNFSGSLSDNVIGTIFEDNSGTLWVGTKNGLDKFEYKTERFVHYRHDPKNIRSIGDNAIGPICEGDSGSLWIGTFGGGLNRLDVKSGDFTHYNYDPKNPASLGNDKVSALCRTSDGALWVGTYEWGGLNILRQNQQRTKRFDRYKGGAEDESGLSEWRIRSVYEDRSGNVWIGTDNGLDKVSRTKRFMTYLAGTMIRAVYIDRRGYLWIGTMGNGIVVLDTNKREVARYIHDPSSMNSLSSNHIYCFYEDRFGTMWIGTWQGGLNSLVIATGKITRYLHRPAGDRSLPGDEVYTISEDEVGRLWIDSNDGTKILDRKTNLFSDYPKLSGPRFKDSFGLVWFSTWGGIVKVDKRGQTTTYRHDPHNPHSINDDRVTAVCEDRDGNLWIGTGGSGINRFDRTTESFTPISSKDGLPGDFIFGMLADNEGKVWISTEKGLARYDPTRKIIRNYDISDGLPTNKFYWGQPCVSKEGEMFFGSVRGVVSFRPREIRPNLIPPPVVLTSFNTLHKPVRFSQEISEVKELEIAYRENVFSFEVAALDFTSQQKNQYAYMMEGFDKDWTYAGTRRYFTYTNLNPGTYIFRAKGSNSDGIWNEEGVSVALTIVPPFWLTWWFMTLVGAALLGVLIYAYNWRVNNLIQIERTRDRIARDLHDDVASTLGSVSLYIESLRRKLQRSPPGTRDLLGKISSLSLEAVDSMGDIVWSVSPEHDSLNDMLVHMRDLGSQLCTANEIEYEIQIARNPNEMHLDVEVRKNIYLIFKESMNNIVKHAHAHHVKLAASVNEGVFEMTIQDDGKGFAVDIARTKGGEAKQPARGHGIRNMAKRAKEVKAEFSVTSKPGAGTTVHLSKKMT